MTECSGSRSHRPRELRRRVMLPARVRTSAGWGDACILNVSTRGLLITARSAVPAGESIELRNRDQAIVAIVVWRSGTRLGLRAEDRVPIENIVDLSSATSLQLIAEAGRSGERRRRSRTHEASRATARMGEFVGTVTIAVLLASGAFGMVRGALARPLATIEAALTY